MKIEITVVGLGAGTIEQIPLGVYQLLHSSDHRVFVRTEDHPVLETLKEEGVRFNSFDSFYKKYDQFEQVYEAIVEFLIEEASKSPIIYAVPGHPMLAERTVKLLLERQNVDQLQVQLKGGQSYLDNLFQVLQIDPIEGFQFVDATSFHRFELQYSNHLIFCQVYDEMIASEVKLTLLEDLPYDFEVTVVNGAGTDQENIKKVPLVELDRSVQLSNLTSVYVPPVEKELLPHQFNRLREVIATLRSPNGCPWDQAQTHESLRPYLIEEAYEVIEAINHKDDEELPIELGDVLLQVMLHSQIGEDQGYFSVDDVIKNITEKMIRRHPHVFGNAIIQNNDELIDQWDAIKREEKGIDDAPTSILDNLEKALPNLLYALELQKKVGKVGFDWDNVDAIWDKLNEEIEEFQEAIKNKDSNHAEKELGDILFSIVNVARFYSINPELALFQTNSTFKTRFQYIEKKAKEAGLSLENMSLAEMDQLWNEAKERE